jgi:transposase
MPRNQRSYTAEFRANAVKLATEMGTSAAARELKISANTLHLWTSKARKGELPLNPEVTGTKSGKSVLEQMKDLEQENKMLKGEIANLTLENKILEDAASFFASRRKK